MSVLYCVPARNCIFNNNKSTKYFHETGEMAQGLMPLSLGLEFDHWDLLGRREPIP